MTESLLRRCVACGAYSLRVTCSACHGATRTPHPARYSPQDRWARYRRALYREADAPTGSAKASGSSPSSES